MIFRYDNEPHYPSLPKFPHHKHVADEAPDDFSEQAVSGLLRAYVHVFDGRTEAINSTVPILILVCVMSEIVYPALIIDPEEYKKYRGRHVALFDGKILADGSNSVEALESALRKHPELKPEKVALYYIQVADVLIL